MEQPPTKIQYLPSIIKKNGFVYKQLAKVTVTPTKSVAIYTQHEKDSDDVIAYEVFIVPYRKKPILTPTKTWALQGEVFPSNERFGTFAKSIYVGNQSNNEAACKRACAYYEQFQQHILDEL